MCEHCVKLKSLVNAYKKDLGDLFYKKAASNSSIPFVIALYSSTQDAVKVTLQEYQQQLEEFLKKTEKKDVPDKAMELLLELKNLNELLNNAEPMVKDIYTQLYHTVARRT